MDLKDRIVVVTGANGALGQVVRKSLAGAGAVPVGIARRGAEGVVAADLGDAFATQAAVREILERHGRIDALLNIAGGFATGPAEDADLWARMWKLNFLTALHATRAVLPGMKQQGSGAIVSVAARVQPAAAKMGAYAASKSAVIRMTESLSAEAGGHGVRVNCVMPSIIDTPANRKAMPDADFDRWVPPEALADVMLYLCSDAARAINGAAIPVFGRA